MIALLLAFVNFVVTVAIHVAEISVKVTIKAIQVSAKVGSEVAKQGAKAGVKVAKKSVETGKKAVEKGSDVVKETKEDAKAEKESAEEETKRRRISSVEKKLLSLQLLQKALHTAVFLLRASLVCVVVYLFVLITLVATGTLALTASAGYVALAYNNGNLDSTEDNSFDITKDVKGSEEKEEKGSIPNADASVSEKLEAIAKWYIKNIPTYQYNYPPSRGSGSRKMYKCDLLNCNVGDDCTGFAGAFAAYVSGEKSLATNAPGSSTWASGSWNGTKYGFKKISPANISVNDLQTGDILATNGHAEIFVAKDKSFGWGSVQTEYPRKKTWSKSDNCFKLQYDSRSYTCVYRYVGK